MEEAPEWSEEKEERDKRAEVTKAVRVKRREIIRHIKAIKPHVGKNLKDVEIPGVLFELARGIVADPEPSLKFSKVPVYELLLGHLERRPTSLREAPPVLDGWKLASTSLFRYALNLILAPNRAEFKKMKVSVLGFSNRPTVHFFPAALNVFLRVQHTAEPPPCGEGVCGHGVQGSGEGREEGGTGLGVRGRSQNCPSSRDSY